MDTVVDSTVDETSSVATVAMADYAFALVPILNFAGHYVKKQSLDGLSLLGYGWGDALWVQYGAGWWSLSNAIIGVAGLYESAWGKVAKGV